jgi:phage terminase large subunit
MDSIAVSIERMFLPKQIETLLAIMKYRYILYSGAVRAGKTLLAAHIAIRACMDNPGVVGMMGSLTTPQLNDVVFRVFQQELLYYQKAFNKAGIPIEIAQIKRSKGDMKAIFWNGSEVMFKPCDDETKIRGLTLDFACLDEPIEIDESIFKQLINRISGTGNLDNQFILLTTNPGSQSHWIYKRFFESDDDNYCTIQTTTYDNVLLPRYEEYIEELKGSGDEDWVRRFLNGTWDAFAGQVYKEFSKDKCTGNYTNPKEKNTYKEPPKFDYYVAGVDWGFRNPSCILTIGITSDKEVYIIDEYYMREKPSHLIAKEIAKRHQRFGYRKVYCDPSNPDLITQTYDLGVPIGKADRDVHGRIGKIKSIIKKNKLHIDKKCVNLIREMELYQYKKDKTGNNKVEEPAKLDDHAPDALGYGLTDYRAFISAAGLVTVSRKLWKIGGQNERNFRR